MFVSVVIPTLNPGPAFDRVLEAIFQQQVDGDLEVIVVDSGSTDQTVSLIREYPVKLLEVAQADFNHGRTRNLGISRARGEYVALLVQDAVPANPLWLRNLTLPFREDGTLAGAYGRQIPRPEAGFFTRRMYSIWGVCSEQPLTKKIDDRRNYEKLTWKEKAHFCAFSNVSSVIRRSIWKKTPFPEVEYAEDLAWAKAILEGGYRLAYCPDSVVIHSHHRTWMERLQRAYTDGRLLPQIFEADPPFPGESVLEAVAHLLYKAIRTDGRTVSLTSLDGRTLAKALPSGGIPMILSESSPWMAGSAVDRKKDIFLNEAVSAMLERRQWGVDLARVMATVWLKLLAVPGPGDALQTALQQRHSNFLTRMWEDWVLFWAMLSVYAGAPLPPDLTTHLMGYLKQFLPAPEEEISRVWLNVLIGIGGKYLGEASWAATSRGMESGTLNRIEQWIREERPQP